MEVKDFKLPYPHWELVRVVKSYYPNTHTSTLCLVTGFTKQQVYRIASAFNVKKTDEFKAELLRMESEKLMKSGYSHRFKKDQVAFNKGKKMCAEVYEKHKPTMFKKGNSPHNIKYDGHISVRCDSSGKSYFHIRTGKGCYKLLHRFLWEKYNGPIPNGFIVVFRNGNTMDCTIENLELITREENMRRNSMLNRYPSDVVAAIRLNGALKRRIRNLQERW